MRKIHKIMKNLQASRRLRVGEIEIEKEKVRDKVERNEVQR